MLLAFLLQGLWIIENKPTEQREYAVVHCGRSLWGIASGATCEVSSGRAPRDSVIAARTAAAPLLALRTIEGVPVRNVSEWELYRFIPWLRTAARAGFLVFGVWLGGGLWWVARRLFGNAGGYVALALYCSSHVLLNAATTLTPEIIAAWGTFGATYTAIGIGHTIYAPVREWKYRVLLLGAALGSAYAAIPAVGIVATALCLVFLIYLTPERRAKAVAALCAAAAIAAMVAVICAALRIDLLRATLPAFSARWTLRFFSQLANIPLYAMAAVALAVFFAWKRARYFGNWAPLAAAVALPWFTASWTALEPLVWTLPFLFVFIGGIFADLFETRLRRQAIAAAAILIAVNAILSWKLLHDYTIALQHLGMR